MARRVHPALSRYEYRWECEPLFEGGGRMTDRRLTPGDYRAGATETLDNLLYPFARHLSRTVGGLRQDVDRIAAQIDRKDLGSDRGR